MKESEKANIEKYAKDIETIKSILMQAEENPLIEHWAYYTWGGLVLVGSLLQYYATKILTYSIAEVFSMIWLPVILIALFLETIAWIKRMARESIPFFSRETMKVSLSATGIFIGAFIIVSACIQMQAVSVLPGIILILFSFFLFMYGLITYTFIYGYAYFLLIAAIILHLVQFDSSLKFLLMGIICSLTFIAAGITAWQVEKKRNGNR
jgi:hypothetical protein